MFRRITTVFALYASLHLSASLAVTSSSSTGSEASKNHDALHASKESREGARLSRAVHLQSKEKQRLQVFGTGTVGALADQSKVPRGRQPSIGQLKQVAGVPAAWPLNGAFEVGTVGETPDFWVRDGNTVQGCTPGTLVSTDFRTGTRCVQLATKSCLLTGWDPRSMLSVEAGKEYTLKYYSKNTGPAEWASFFNVYSTEHNTSTHVQLRTVLSSMAQKVFSLATGSADWVERTHAFTAAETSERVRLTLATNTGTVLIDDITFTLDCPTRISVSGATDVSHVSAKMGTYVKDPTRSKTGQAVYMLEGSSPPVYMYFWDDSQQWVIGSDITTLVSSSLQSVQVDPENCPDSSGGAWSVWDGSHWVARTIAVDNVMVMSLMGAGGLHA